MTATWDPDTLASISSTDDFHVASFREDGTTYGTLTWIWSVVVDDNLYIRAWNGRRSRWYRAAVTQKAGRITAAGTPHEVTFEEADPAVNTRVDAAYQVKYAGSPYLQPMLQDGPTAATVRVTPR